MIGRPSVIAAIIGLAFIWVGIGAVMAVILARRLRKAQSVLDVARANAALLRQSPARPLLVRPDNSIDIDPALARSLGFDQVPARLMDLSREEAGIGAEGQAALETALGQSSATATSLA